MATTTATTTEFSDQTPSSLAAQSLLSTAPPSNIPSFTFTPFLRNSLSQHLLTTTPACPAHVSGQGCPLGRRCPNRHPTPSNNNTYHQRKTNDSYVCKHWLKGLCKKGENCDYLHEYNLRKMSECQFFNQNGYCQNGDECLYLHVKEESRLPLCEDYERGFCERGPRCGKRHVRRKLCEFYMAGFCPDGKECTRGVHLKANLPPVESSSNNPNQINKQPELDRDRKDFDGDGRMEEGEREERKPMNEFRGRGGGGGRYTGRGRWRNKR